MIAAYIDSSVVLRLVLRETDPLQEWTTLTGGVSSVLARVECHRSLERRWRLQELTEEELEKKRALVDGTLARFNLWPVDAEVLDRAANLFPTFIATLDAIHLATALAYRRAQPEDERPILFATHDRQLAKAAAALDFGVIGVAA